MNERILGAQINGALYLASVTWIGWQTTHLMATYLAIAAFGVTYLAYLVQIALPYSTKIGNSLVAVSVLLGASAGIMLLI